MNNVAKHLAFVVFSTASFTANASPILFVSDSNTDTSIATALSGAGHTVTSFTNQYVAATGASTALLGSLSSYDAIFWSATGTGLGSLNNNASMFANLSSYVSGGGSVFVTGYDSISSPSDPVLRTFLGGSSNVDTCGAPGTISAAATSLTTGVVDIRGLTPGTIGTQTCDRDGLGGLSVDTLGLVASSGSTGFFQWTLRSLGLGEIAYVSNGNYNTTSESSMWADPTSTYNAAVRNFASNATQGSVPEPATVALMGLGLAGIGFARKKKQS